MAERRSLVAGIEEIGGVDPDVARAFIVQEPRRAEGKSSPVRVVPDQVTAAPAEAADVQAEVEEVREAEKKPPALAAAKRPSRPAAQKRQHEQRLLATLLVPVTVRLRPEIASALKQASLQRQLNGFETFTQQDIVEEALVPWLQAEGLLDD